ncbi:MAG: amino acid ABC transporter permease [Betaproteobacteria bacterium]|nr:amino acid ABC transporter permease [Betaproteobacteria bacterium]
MEALIHDFFNIEVIVKVFPLVLNGLGMTLLVCAAVIPLGLGGGLIIAFGMHSRWRMVRIPVMLQVDFFRSVPPLVLLIFIYSGLPFIGIRPSPYMAVCVAFLLNTSAYYGEVYRAGLESVGAGQSEAARSTGLTKLQTTFFVVLPQAVRNVLPDLISNTIEVVKLTALASVVGLPEMLYSSDMGRAMTQNASPIVLAAAIYLLMLWPVVRMVSRLEHRLGH